MQRFDARSDAAASARRGDSRDRDGLDEPEHQPNAHEARQGHSQAGTGWLHHPNRPGSAGCGGTPVLYIAFASGRGHTAMGENGTAAALMGVTDRMFCLSGSLTFGTSCHRGGK